MVVTGEVRICWVLASLVHGAPVLLLKGKVLGKPLPSARHTSVSPQRRGPGLGLMKLLRETDYSCPFGHLQKSDQFRNVLHSCCPAILGVSDLVVIFYSVFLYKVRDFDGNKNPSTVFSKSILRTLAI